MYFRSHKKNNKDVYLSEAIGFDKDGNEINLIDVMEDKSLNIHKYIDDKNNIDFLRKFFNILNDKEKNIIIKRYGLNNEPEKTQKQIAKEMHISRSYVSRIEKRALTKLLTEFIRYNQI